MKPTSLAAAPDVLQPARFAEWMAGVLTGPTVRCVAVLFEPDGALRLKLEAGGTALALGLIGAEGAPPGAVPALYGALVPATTAEPPAWKPVAAWVARRLELVRQRYHVPLLDLFRDERPSEPYTFGEGLFHSRLGPLLVPGVTRCGRFVLVRERLDGEALTYELESDRGRVVLRLHLDAATPGAVFRTHHLAATLAVDERTPSERAQPENQVERYLGFLLARCDAPGATYRRRPQSRRAFVDDRVVFDARLDAQFFVREVGHDYLNIFAAFWALDWPAELLIHGEHECAAMGTHCPTGVRRFWTTNLEVRPGASVPEHVSTTALDDVDLIKGGEDRLRADVDALRREHPDRLLVVMNTCVPQVIGDDVEGIIEGLAAEGGPPLALISCRMEEANPFRGAQAFWLSILRHEAVPDIAPAAASVNLVGLGLASSPAVKELSALLAAVGVGTNAVLWPGLEREHARRFLAADLAVLNPWRYVVQAFEPLRAWSRRPVLTPSLPCGREGTRRWLQEVAEAVTGGAPASVPDLGAEQAALWQRLAGQAATLEVAFVTLSTQPDLPADPTVTQGLPLLTTLLEMGFRVTVHCLDPAPLRDVAQRRPPADLEAELRERLGDTTALSFCVAPDLDGLWRTLGAARPALLYSEIVDDPRLKILGVEQVGPADFQLGLAGALRTLQELVRRAQDPFRARFARHLAAGRTLP